MNVDDYIEAKLTHQLHTSERLSRRGCRRRHAWIFRDMYYPKITAKPLEFGVAYHKAMEVYYDPANRPAGQDDVETCYQLARVAFKKSCEEQRVAFIRNFPEQYTVDVDLDYAERVELGFGMLDFWHKTYSPKYDLQYTPVKVEIPFEVAIDGLWCKCDQCWNRWRRSGVGVVHHDKWQVESRFSQTVTNDPQAYRAIGWQGLPVTYGGRVDCLVVDTNGDYWIVDWKTTSRMTASEPNVGDEFLLLDDQITSYCWAFWKLGIPVKGFIYVEIRKGFPQQPEPNKVQRLGRWYSVNKTQDTTYEIYLKTVMENDAAAYEEGLYNDFLDWLKVNATLENYVHRHQIIRNEAELRNAGRNIRDEARELIDQTLPLFPSPGRFACNWCAFRDPCIAMNRDEDYEFTLNSLYDKRTQHYWETAESTTDKRYS